MAEPDARLKAELARLAAAIDRAATDLTLDEEPARFLAALEGGTPGPTAGAPEASRD